MATPRPVRVMDHYAAEFWKFTEQKELRLQKCEQCSHFRWPAAAVCPSCLAEEYEWAQINGTGKLLTWVTFERPYFDQYLAPHTTIMVELDEGPLFISWPLADEEDLRDGLPMQLEWVDAEDQFGEYNLPVFRPAD